MRLSPNFTPFYFSLRGFKGIKTVTGVEHLGELHIRNVPEVFREPLHIPSLHGQIDLISQEGGKLCQRLGELHEADERHGVFEKSQ